MNAFQELKKTGVRSKRSHQFGEFVPISRDQNGQWFFCTKNGFHKEDERNFLPLNQLPILKQALSSYEMIDSELRTIGGRVFVGDKGVFRKK